MEYVQMQENLFEILPKFRIHEKYIFSGKQYII